MKRALVSVSDKTNLVPFVKGLEEHGYEIVSTGGLRRPWMRPALRRSRLKTSPTSRKSWTGG
ncbi:hypothetical protein QPX96_10960 [Limosilactobacillus fermentum]|nr:hypothetical protein [Limosilactobacillus fermentum]